MTLDTAAARWTEVERWLDAALARPDDERLAWLAGQGLDPELHVEVAELLAAEAASRAWAPGSGSAAERTLADGAQVGVWRVQSLLGRGASGEVYRVLRTDGDFEQPAALKLLRHAGDPGEERRFAAERRLLARLEDPAIARLIDGGSHQGRMYAVMELVDGVPLDEHAAGLPLAGRMALVLQVVQAVAVAHAHGVVHRDLKPANVLVDRQGRVRLLDFGIARLMDAEGGDAGEGRDPAPLASLRLTPSYCAPEQLQGRPVGPAADVYALGVILYRLLGGTPLWRLEGSNLQRAMQRLRPGEALLPPSHHAPRPEQAQLRGDLDAIVLRCLHDVPTQRYSDASALRDELLRWQRGLPVLARGDSPGYVLWRLVRRHRLAFSAGAAVVVSLLLGLAGVLWQARQAAVERDIARGEAATNKAVRDYLLTMFRVAGEQGGEAPTARGMLAQAAERLAADLDRDPGAAAPTLLALAQLYFQLNDYVGAIPLFEKLLQRSETLSPALLADVRHDLASCLWRTGNTTRSAELLDLAQAHWQADGPAAAVRLLESRMLQSQLARSRGDVAASVAILEAALPQRLALSGERHVETATLLNNLATARFHAGQLGPARQAFERAWGIWQALGAEHSADGLNTLNNWAALALREGRPEEAERLFGKALELRRAHLPPSAAQAALQNNLGKMMLRRGAAAQALPLLTEALEMGERFSGAASQLTLSAMAGVAEAQLALGDLAAAQVATAELLVRAERQWGAAHPLNGLAHLTQARLLGAERRWPQAEASMARAEAIWTAAGAAGAPFLAQARQVRTSWAAAR